MGEKLAQFMSAVGKYLLNLAVWLDQGVNTIFGGDPDETVTSRASKARSRGRRWGCVLCSLLDRIQKGHCDRYVELDEGKDAL